MGNLADIGLQDLPNHENLVSEIQRQSQDRSPPILSESEDPRPVRRPRISRESTTWSDLNSTSRVRRGLTQIEARNFEAKASDAIDSMAEWQKESHAFKEQRLMLERARDIREAVRTE